MAGIRAQTFPHYTRHTIEHSEEIILQISKLLFRDEDDGQPVLPALSGVEAYILIIAAFLHDAGMVASDAEKVQILSSAEWKSWIDTGGGAKRWREIETFAAGDFPADANVRTFLADIQRRFLIAELIRRMHHTRSAAVVRQHHDALGRLAFGDETLANTIADICEAHGFRTHELDNHEKFPDRRDLRDGTVNVQLMAILLRLGDLLDMSYDRACPLLLNAACPLPADSYAHWTQYKRIKHRMTSSDRIEVTAECMQQDEHRFLYDWCKWLVDEIRVASTLTMRARRHGGWRPPEAEIEGEKATIHVRRHRDATYIPSTWTFELDRDAVFQRLIYDAYDDRRTFLRELIQNAADASRCALYALLPPNTAPASPTKIDARLRQRFPITVTIGRKAVVNPMSSEIQEKQVITIEDLGVGMDRFVIEHFFLQIGRSFYVTDEFRRSYEFTPSSRFGIGFLSAFAVSDEIEVETLKAGCPDGALLLKLTGPRTYLLTERSPRTHPGTRVTLVMRQEVKEEDCVEAVCHWCKRLEFPVMLTTSSGTVTIEAEKPEDFLIETPDLSEAGAVFRVRAFPIDEDGVEGELYVIEHEAADGGITWLSYERSSYEYKREFPLATIPAAPPQLRCVSGINGYAVGLHLYAGMKAARIDFRRNVDLAISRLKNPGNDLPLDMPAIRNRAIRAVKEHLSSGNTRLSASYRQHFASELDIDELWNLEPAMIEIKVNGRNVQLSHREAQDLARIGIVLQEKSHVGHYEGIPLLSRRHGSQLSPITYHAVFEDRGIEAVIDSGEMLIAIFSRQLSVRMFGGFHVTKMPSELLAITFWWGRNSDSSTSFINESHELMRWLLHVHDTARAAVSLPQSVDALLASIEQAADYPTFLRPLNNILKVWAAAPDLPEDLKPPITELTYAAFGHSEKE